VFSKIVSKVLVDKGVLDGRGEKVLFLVFMILGLMSGNMGKDIKTDNWGRGNRSTGDDVSCPVGDVEERKVFNVVKSGPVDSGRRRVLEFGRLRDNGLEDTGSDIERTWIVPSVVRALKDLKDGGSSVCNILLVDVIKGRPGGNRDVGEGGGGDDGRLRRSEQHSILN